MKKYTSGLILLVIGLIAIAHPGWTEEKRKTNRYSGVVQEVSVKEKTISAGRENRSIAMLFDASKATFTNIKGLRDLKPGDKVVIEYDAMRGQTIAITVTREP